MGKFCDKPAEIEVSFQMDRRTEAKTDRCGSLDTYFDWFIHGYITFGRDMGDGEAEIFRKLASHLLKFEDTLPPLMMMYHQFHKTMKYCDLEFLLVTFSKYKGGIKGIKSCLHCVF